ncbi:MAG: NAD(P)H-dependent oxidoreductase [Acidobacteria bacterium]|nr:NAD(P)H-dependent oxidoreductase [Acidobacteriota bacterium]
MRRHLHTVVSSPRGDRSWSRRALQLFVDGYRTQFPDAEVTSRDTTNLPHLSLAALSAGRTPLAEHTADQAAAFALQAEIVNEVEHCSHLLFATPMWNWSTPSSLKAWVDHFVNIRTFYGAPSVLAGKPVSVIISSGGLYSEGPQSVNDTLRPWFENFFARLGATEFAFLNCDPTGPMDWGGLDPDADDAAWTKVRRQIEQRLASVDR